MNNGINKRNMDGETALIIAAPKGNIEEVRSLLNAGADPCARDRHGMTARIRAQNRSHNEIVALLLEAEEKAGCNEPSDDIADKNVADGAVDRPGSGNLHSTSFQFSLYSHPTLGYEAVKNGFSWPAFFFTWIWAFIKKLWVHGIVFIVVMFVLLIFESVFREEGSYGGVLLVFVMQFGACLLFGLNGNKWRTESMSRRGYALVAGSMAATPDAAIAEISNRRDQNPKDNEVAPQSAAESKEMSATENKFNEQVITSDYAIYEQIADELESGEMNRALWTKALAISEGDIDKQKALYVQLRASHLRNDQV